MNEDAILSALARIEGAIAALREEVARGNLRPPRREVLDVADRRRLGAILPVLHGQLGGEPFACWEVYDTVAAGGVPGSDLRLVLGDLKAHGLGKLLRRAADSGTTVAGFIVRFEGRDGEGRRWIVIRSSLTGDGLAGKVRASDSRGTR